MAATPIAILPGRSLGPFFLGASLHEVLTVIKEERRVYPVIDLHHSHSDPLATPVVVALPHNGLRFRFDAPEQRLRLIELVDFRPVRLAYKGNELVKNSDDALAGSRPSFRRIYQIFGASYPGEYHPPTDGTKTGSYVLSWSGVAFTFPLDHSAYGPQKDHVSMLASSAASPATQMALFEGSSWPEARRDLFVRTPTGPRLPALAQRPRDGLPAEIECASIEGQGNITLIRTPPAAPFVISLHQTTPQDLITELGPPDATRTRDIDAGPTQQPVRRRASSTSKPFTNGRAHTGSQPSSYSSTGTDTFDADFDSGDAVEDDSADRAGRETFWCYFRHGMDILVGPPSPSTSTSTATNTTPRPPSPPHPSPSHPHLTVLKVILHANIPGSYTFNRHRRLRWSLSLPAVPWAKDDLHSEANFHRALKPALLQAFRGVWPESEMSRGKVVNRTWGGGGAVSPSSSGFFLADVGGMGDEGGDGDDGGVLAEVGLGGGSEEWLGNTRVYSFPGLGVEVLENGVVGSLSVY